MKVTQVIHGFPPHYMAGSEIYTYNLSKALAKMVDVTVFTRIENPYENCYKIVDEDFECIKVRRVNKPQRDYTFKDKYLDPEMDKAFRQHLKEFDPGVAHFGHLSHLSTNMVNIAKEEFGLPVVFTVHDFWLFCVRGQLINPDLKICHGVSMENCLPCLKQTHKETLTKADYLEYKAHMDRVIRNIDIFLSPSQFVRDFLIRNGVPKAKVVYSKYGFNKSLITPRRREYSKDSQITFGFMGRIIPAKGLRLLLEAFNDLHLEARNLIIFGDPGPSKSHLERYCPKNAIFKGYYRNSALQGVLDQMDVLVVPSIWYENSPLVIQEAFMAGVPVITSNIGGMVELVEDGVDGFTFEVGNKTALKNIMQKVISNPEVLNGLKVNPKKVRSIEDDAKAAISIYRKVMA